jgi:hypothetical protein
MVDRFNDDRVKLGRSGLIKTVLVVLAFYTLACGVVRLTSHTITATVCSKVAHTSAGDRNLVYMFVVYNIPPGRPNIQSFTQVANVAPTACN